jgi:hypothetical protein
VTTNFGTDLYSLDDIDETRTVTGVELVAQDAFWALQTEPGQGILAADAPSYGLDLLGLLGTVESDADAAALPDKIRAALKNDERILEVDTTIARTVEGPAVTYAIEIRCTTGEGPFSLVGKSDGAELDLAVQLLPGGI